ncbi:MAG: hypothetical protein CL693_15800 [Cellvibrionaceae bacterium]|nr:hypothetical protein [Cellvibrionaceae bacterium]
MRAAHQICLALITGMGVFISTAATGDTMSHNNSEQIIIHHRHQVVAVANRQTLKAIYTLRQQYWDDGTPIRLITLPANHPLHKRFTRQQLGFYPYQLQRCWDRLAFSGTAIEPIEVDSEAAMIEAVKSHKGAIGYINSNTSTEEVGHVHLH